MCIGIPKKIPFLLQTYYRFPLGLFPILFVRIYAKPSVAKKVNTQSNLLCGGYRAVIILCLRNHSPVSTATSYLAYEFLKHTELHTKLL